MPSSSYSEKALLPVGLLLAALGVGSPLAFGGSHPAVVGAITALSGLTLVLLGRARRKQGRRVAPGPLPWITGAGALWCLLQAIPVPPAMLRLLSPQTMHLREVMFPGLTDAWAPTSAAPMATLAAASGWVALTCVLAVAADLGRQEENRSRLATVIAAAGIMVLATALAHWLMNLPGPYGLMPSTSHAPLVTSFPSAINAAALLSLAAFTLLGLSLQADTRAHAFNWAAGAVMCVVGVAFSGSTVTMLGIQCGVLLNLVLILRQVSRARSGGPSPRRGNRAISLVVVAVVLVLLLLMLDRPAWLSLPGFQNVWKIKLEGLEQTMAVLPEYWATGMGAGTFAEVFSRHKTSATQVWFVDPGSSVLRLVVEWGIPASVAWVLAVIWAVKREWQENPGELHLALRGGLLCFCVDNVFQESVACMGVAIPAAVMVTLLRRPVVSPAVQTSEERRYRSRLTTTWAVRFGAAALLAATPCLWVVRHGRDSSRERAWAAPLGQRAAALEKHLRMHPTDYLAALSLVRVTLATTPQQLELALQWVNRALFLNPTHAATHVDAARVLWGLGLREQAALEFHAAQRLDPAVLGVNTLEELHALGMTVDELQLVFQHRGLRWVCEQLVQHQPGAAEACWLRLAWQDPNDAAGMVATAEQALSHGNPKDAERLARAALAKESGLGWAAVTLARILDSQGEQEAADQVLEHARTVRPDPLEVDRLRFDRAFSSGDLGRARGVLGQWHDSAVRRGSALDEVMVAEGRIEEKAGNQVMAMQHYRNAARANPRQPEGAVRAATLAASVGNEELAMSILHEAHQAAPHPRYQEMISRLEIGARTARLRGQLSGGTSLSTNSQRP